MSYRVWKRKQVKTKAAIGLNVWENALYTFVQIPLHGIQFGQGALMFDFEKYLSINR